MHIQLIKGKYTRKDAVELLEQMFLVKIQFHENKIEACANEEDIKMREKRIKQLHVDLMKAKEKIESSKEEVVDISSVIEI